MFMPIRRLTAVPVLHVDTGNLPQRATNGLHVYGYV